MATDLIHDRGRGPELVGTRITVYDLLGNFMDPMATEAYICKLYDLSPEQVAAARAYILNHPDTVLAGHLEIEARMAEGNPPEVIEQAERVHAMFLKFKEWSEKERKAIEAAEGREGTESGSDRTGAGRGPNFRDWFMAEVMNTDPRS